MTRIGCKAGAAYYASAAPNPNLLVGAIMGKPSDATDAFFDAHSVFQQSEPTTYINTLVMGLPDPSRQAKEEDDCIVPLCGSNELGRIKDEQASVPS
ncbi:hypothetical protein E2562_020342 [Oryza meyeriana var. granulata]|uniref:Endoglucanase n=1 Tax=Oryza meyeriana var. granulata TaxID=110450 RepID=A0A6G1EBT0_9ORYZ|nr:hypothetical protein E2562_020342 [Oryza meyeriana var. granulata]